MPLKVIRNIFIILALLTFSFGVGYRFGHRDYSLSISTSSPSFSVVNRTNLSHSVDFSLFWDVWDRLSRTYINKDALDPQKMLYGAISGMVSSLNDPYTVFLSPKQNKETKDELGGSFEGIGAQLGLKDKQIVVVAPLPGTPAQKAGIKSGDAILKIDGKTTEGVTLPEAVSLIRGQKGTKVVLNIFREKAKEPVDVEIVRDTIHVKSVEWEVRKSQAPNPNDQKTKEEVNVIYLKLAKFGDETEQEWNRAVEEINKFTASAEQKSPSKTGQAPVKNLKGLILDLRSNPGGYLNGAVYIASEFLPQGKTVVVQEQASGEKQTYTVERAGRLLDIPMVVLVDKGSASASEIVAGALLDYQRATLVGEKSFGKGSVQEAQELSGGAGLHITTAKWLLPKGSWINGTGIMPQVVVSMDEKNPEKDPQLDKAIEILAKD